MNTIDLIETGLGTLMVLIGPSTYGLIRCVFIFFSNSNFYLLGTYYYDFMNLNLKKGKLWDLKTF